MKNKLILLITILLTFTIFVVPVSAFDNSNEVETTTVITFKVDKNVKASGGKFIIQNNIIHNGLSPYEYVIRNQEVTSDNLPSPYALGVEKPGYSFTGWKIEVDTNDMTTKNIKTPSFAMLVPAVREIRATAVATWRKNNLTVNYNVNYGAISETSKYTTNKYGNIIKKENKKLLSQKFTYGVIKENGLVNAKTFELERNGYIFVGWSAYKNGKTLLDENKALTAEKISKKVLESDAQITLYAQWMPKTVNIVYALNDDTEKVTNYNYETENGTIKLRNSNSIYSQKYSMTKSDYIKINSNIFELTKPFSEFAGWTTTQGSNKVVFKAGQKITYKEILPLLTTGGKVLRLYPVWKNYSFPLDKSGGIFISSLQGTRMHPVYNEERYHAGLDIAAGYGTKIYAVEDGTISEIGLDKGYGYGNYVKIYHGNGVETLYAHASKLLVKEGDKVKKGDVIAKVGSTGTSTGNHLHLEIIIKGECKDPMDYIDFSGVPVKL